jgi:L-histidine N-alpha-methyltransferase
MRSAWQRCRGTGKPRLFLFLGSSLGNMEWPEMDALLAQIYRHTAPGDYLLVGADLDKDPAVIDRAYNDAAGFGARSTLNMLAHLNWRYGGDFAMDQFAYRSAYDAGARRNEVRIESLVQQTVTLRDLEFRVALGESELIDAEVMWKFEPMELTQLLENAGFSLVREWIEPVYRYGIFLSAASVRGARALGGRRRRAPDRAPCCAARRFCKFRESKRSMDCFNRSRARPATSG